MPCTGQAEIIAYYDGAAPVFSLADETNPNGGINLTYQGALPYTNADGTDRCPALDPSTGYQVQRYLNIFIACDKNAKTLVVDGYTERGQCQYYITGRAAAACGSKGDPFEAKYYDGDAFGFVVLGWVLLAPITYISTSPPHYLGGPYPFNPFFPSISRLPRSLEVLRF